MFLNQLLIFDPNIIANYIMNLDSSLDVFGHTIFLKLVNGWFSDAENPTVVEVASLEIIST